MTETLKFTYQLEPSVGSIGNSFKQYTRSNGKELLTSGPSDIFLIEATQDSSFVDITFISSDTESVIAPPQGFTASAVEVSNGGPLTEKDDYQDVFRLVDANNPLIARELFQARSDTSEVPIPSAFFLLASEPIFDRHSTRTRPTAPEVSSILLVRCHGWANEERRVIE